MIFQGLQGAKIYLGNLSVNKINIGDTNIYTDTWNIGIQTTVSNDIFGISVYGLGPNITVDWGDGLVETFNTQGDKTHTYSIAGSYIVKIKGEFSIPSPSSRITLGTEGKTSANKVKFTSAIPTIKNLATFGNCFGQTSLTSVPVDLFDNNPQVSNFASCFSNCSSLVSIPQGLFNKTINAQDFTAIFLNCTSLTGIPIGLFDNNSQATNFASCFRNCLLINSIPANLFKFNPLVTNFSGAFFNCDNITRIPTGLFDNNPLVTLFTGTFEQCTNLVSIPDGLFSNNPLVTKFDYCFNLCPSLTSIPTGLFDNNPLVTTFSTCFAYNYSLQNIPIDLFKHNRLVQGFGACFYQSYGLSDIPSTLFATNTAVIPLGFGGVFFNVPLTTASYSNLLIDMASNATSRSNNLNFGANLAKYNTAGQTARDTLTAKGWTFVDSGLDV